MKERACSDSWYIVTTMAIFFFLFQWLEIYSLTIVIQCNKISDFWLAYPRHTYSPFHMVACIFALICAWSVLDVIRAFYFGYKDKVLAGVVFLGVATCTFFIARGLWAQWEHFEITNVFLQLEDSLFLNVEANRFIIKDPWNDFIKQKRCENPFRTLNISSSEDWKRLEEEFISKGGVLP